VTNVTDLRNIVLLGHGGAGKTSLAESMLHKCGAINRLGSVIDKNTVSDFDDEEKSRGNSIHSALMYVNHADKLINIIDTPGYPDFLGGALQSIPAAETAVIVISASAGIEINTRKMFAAATAAGLARIIVINKIDAENAELAELIGQIQECFGVQCRCANLPKADKSGVIDCFANNVGESPVMDVASANMELLERVVEADDALMEKYLGGETITADSLAACFTKALVAGTIVPIVFTNAHKEIGIIELLSLVAKCAPSPVDARPAKLKKPDGTTLAIKPDPNGPLAGMVIRVGFDPRSSMRYSAVRIYSGSLNSATHLMVDDAKKAIRVGHPLRMQGNEGKEIESAGPGELVTLAKLDELKLGCFIHDGKLEGAIERPSIPKPMYSLALEPASRNDESKLGAALEKLGEEDPCFKVTHDAQTKEMVMSGLGDLHLRVMLAKMEHRYKVSVITHPPKIPYRETITGKGDGHYRHKKQSGGAGQFGEVYLRVEPAPRDSDPSLVFGWDIFGGSIPGQYEPAILKGINDVMACGVVAGFPMQDVKVSVYDGKYHPVDSKEVAFRIAGKNAFIDALQKSKPSLLEPIVNLEITIPADNMGDITGDMASRRGRVTGQDMLPGNMVVVKAQVPLSEVAQYNSQLKSVTGGQGSYEMELSHYETTPPNIQQQVIAQYAKNRQQVSEE